jgi:hypothetical protein
MIARASLPGKANGPSGEADFSAAQRTMKLCVAPVEMTAAFYFDTSAKRGLKTI